MGDGKQLSPRSILQSLRAHRAGLIKDSTTMTIERPIFPPTRRAVIKTAAALPIAAAVPTIAPFEASRAIDPIFAAIDAFRRADAAVVAVDGDIPDELGDQCHEAYLAVVRTRPITGRSPRSVQATLNFRSMTLIRSSSSSPPSLKFAG
jgi:hypothetical protein